MHKRERPAVGIFSINAPVLFRDITVRRVGGNAHAGGHGHKNIAKWRGWRLKRTVCSPVMEEIYVDAISTCVAVWLFLLENLYVASFISLLCPIKFDEYLQCGSVLSYLKRLIYKIRLTLVLLKRYFFKVEIVIQRQYITYEIIYLVSVITNRSQSVYLVWRARDILS